MSLRTIFLVGLAVFFVLLVLNFAFMCKNFSDVSSGISASQSYATSRFLLRVGGIHARTDFAGDHNAMLGCGIFGFLLGMIAIVLGWLGARNETPNKTMLMGHIGSMFFTLIFLCASMGSFYVWRDHTIAFFTFTLIVNLALPVIAFMFMKKPNSAQSQP